MAWIRLDPITRRRFARFRHIRRGYYSFLILTVAIVLSIFAPFLFGWGIEAFGPTVPLLASAGLWILTIVAYAMGPETHRRELEDVQIG